MENKEMLAEHAELKASYDSLLQEKEKLERSFRQLEAEKNYLELLTRNSDWGYVNISPSYEVRNFSPSAARFFQLEGAKFLQNSSTLVECLPPQMHPIFLTSAAAIRQGEKKKEFEFSFASGEGPSKASKHYRFRLLANYDPNQQLGGICFSIKDISNEKIRHLDLAKKNNLITSIFNSTASGICVTDKDGIVVQANKGYCKIYGYELEEILNHHFDKVVPKGHREYARQLHSAIIAEEADSPGEWEVVRKDGELISIFVSKQLIVNPDGSRYLVTTINDISQQKWDRDQLRLTNSHMDAILESTRDPIWFLNADQTLLYFNQAFCKLMAGLGIKPQKGDHIEFDGLPEPMRLTWRKLYKKAFTVGECSANLSWERDGKLYDYEFRFNPFYDELGKIVGLTVFGRNVSKHKQSEREIMASEEKFRKLSESAPIGIFMADQEGLLTYANNRLLEIFGISTEELIGKDLREFIHPAYKGKLDPSWLTWASIRNGGYKEIKILNRQKETRWLRVRTSIQNEDSHKPTTYVGNVEDITDTLIAQNELQRMFEVVPDGIAIGKLGEGVIKANPVFESWMGLSLDGIVRVDETRLIEFIHPDDHIRLLEAFANTVLKGKSLIDLEVRIPMSDGGLRWISLNAIPDFETELFYVSAKDISEKKETEAQIIQSQANLSALINNTQDFILSVDLDSRLLTLNRAYQEYLEGRYGINPQIGERILDKFPKESIPYWYSTRKQILSGDPIYHLYKDEINGKTRYFSINITPIKSGGEVIGFTLFSRDITSHQEDKEALYRTKLLLENILLNAPVAIFAKDKEGCFTTVNPNMAAYMKKKNSEILGKTVHELLPAPQAKVYAEREASVMREGKAQVYSDIIENEGKRLYHQNISFPLFDMDGNSTGIAGIIVDITDLHEAQNKLEELNQRFKLANKAGKIGVWEYNFIDDYLIWDDNTLHIFGIDPGEFTNNYDAWANCLHEEDRAKTERYFAQCVQNSEDFETVFRIVRSNDEIRYILGSGIIYRNKKGEPHKMIGVNMDITEERETQEKIRLARDMAEEMTRLKSNFLSNMSHEIRTPLNGILGLLPMLKVEKDPDTLDEIISMMERSGKRLLDTLIGILDLARIEAEQTDYTLVKINLGKLVEEVFQSLASVAHSKHLEYFFEAPEQDHFVLGDERMLTQIFTNMIGNALKFTSTGFVKVCVNLRHKEERAFVAVEIQDTGIGISKENIAKIFQPFKQESEGIKREYEGSGLGLSIVKRYSEMLEGSIEVKSRKGQGSTFVVLLPRYISESAKLLNA